MGAKRLRRAIPAILLAFGIMLAFATFMRGNERRITAQNEGYVAELTLQRAASIDSLIKENESFIASIAYLYGKDWDSPEPNVKAIAAYESNSVFDYLRFVYKNGDDYTSQGILANLADREYFKAGMRGESGTTYIAESRVTGERQVGFYAPVTYDGQIVGVMVGFYGEDFIQGLLDYELFGNKGEGWLCKRDGTVLGSTLDDAPQNYLRHLAASGCCTRDEISRINDAFAAGQNVSFVYEDDGKQGNGYAVALSSEDWMLVRYFPASAAAQMLEGANSTGELLIIELLGLFGIYIFFLVVNFFAERRSIREAARDASDVSTGVSELFRTFVSVDLESKTYRCVGGALPDSTLPEEGPYESLCAAVLDDIADPEQRAQTSELLLPESLKSFLSEHDRESMRVHAPVEGIEWFTFNFTILERNADGTPKRLLLACQDVTELHRREEAEQHRLEEALTAAKRASRAKTEFLFNMSHDIRTPMNAIIGYTELAQREGTSTDELRSYVSKIDASSKHLLALINDILEMSRIESGKMALEPESCDLMRAMEDIRALFVTQMEAKGITFELSFEGVRNRWVSVDCNRLNRVMLNLVSNAYKFTPEGGHVTVTLIQLDPPGTELRPGDVAAFEFCVRDDGIGMSKEFAEKVFSPFERERTSTVSGIQGTGLGLSITKSIVELMGGTIGVQTEQGVGTEFAVLLFLPVVEACEEGDDEHGEGHSFDFGGKRLLLVEDNVVNREIATLILEQHGFEIVSATNGREGVDTLAGSEPGTFDAVLMDIQMPVMDGYAATREIRGLEDPLLANVPVIAMTANAFAEDVKAAHEAGMDGHIAKPLDVDTMLHTLASVLGA